MIRLDELFQARCRLLETLMGNVGPGSVMELVQHLALEGAQHRKLPRLEIDMQLAQLHSDVYLEYPSMSHLVGKPAAERKCSRLER